MNMLMLVLLALAAARATRLVVDDLLPFGPLRDKLNNSSNNVLQHIGYGLSCTFCISVWSGGLAALLAVNQGWAPGDFWTVVVLWWAFAAVIVLLEGLAEVLMSAANNH